MHGIFLVFSARISAEFFASDTASAVISLVILIPSGLGKKVDTTLSPRRNEMIQKHVKLDSVYLTFLLLYCVVHKNHRGRKAKWRWNKIKIFVCQDLLLEAETPHFVWKCIGYIKILHCTQFLWFNQENVSAVFQMRILDSRTTLYVHFLMGLNWSSERE